jgi:hypothetical protein
MHFFDEKKWFLARFWGVVRVYCCWVKVIDPTCSCDFRVFLKQLIRYFEVSKYQFAKYYINLLY